MVLTAKELNWVNLIGISRQDKEPWDDFTERFTKLMTNFKVSPNIQAIIFIKSLGLTEDQVTKLVKFVDFGNTTVENISKCVKIQLVEIKKEKETSDVDVHIKIETIDKKNESSSQKSKAPGPERPASKSTSEARSLTPSQRNGEEYFKKKLADKVDYYEKKLKDQELELKDFFNRKMSQLNKKKEPSNVDNSLSVSIKKERDETINTLKKDKRKNEDNIVELKERIKYITKRVDQLNQEKEDKVTFYEKKLIDEEVYFKRKLRRKDEKIEDEKHYCRRKLREQERKFLSNQTSIKPDVVTLNEEC